jgi:hypothetical protein
MPRPARLACAAGVTVLATAAGAQTHISPNLQGTWKGTAYAVHIGSNPYRTPDRNGPNLPENGVEFTYTITEQQGNRFAGTSSGGKFSETVIGAISPDNRTGIMLDDDGTYTFTLRNSNTIDLCYQHSFATSRVVACYSVTRSP